MVTLRQSLAVVLCLLHVPNFTFAFFTRSGQDGNVLISPTMFFNESTFQWQTVGVRHGSIALECEVGGSPVPSIHWLKNGEPIPQGSSTSYGYDDAAYEDIINSGTNSILRLSTTRSRLDLDCLMESDEAEYTCVAKIPEKTLTKSTYLSVERPDIALFSEVHDCSRRTSRSSSPAKIYMWTKSRIEFENNTVRLFCRAQGTPKPHISWHDRDGNLIGNNSHYTIDRNGDLLIRDVTWSSNMGVYTCLAHNRYGTDTVESFLYPTTA